jgi:hypothetical protein
VYSATTSTRTGKTIVFVSSNVKTEFYLAQNNKGVNVIDFLDAVNYLRAKARRETIAILQ